jgi:hypothetical protein
VETTVAKVLVTQFNPDPVTAPPRVACDLRKAGLNIAMHFEDERVGDQILYALSRASPA